MLASDMFERLMMLCSGPSMNAPLSTSVSVTSSVASSVLIIPVLSTTERPLIAETSI